MQCWLYNDNVFLWSVRYSYKESKSNNCYETGICQICWSRHGSSRNIFFSPERNNCKKLGVKSPWLCFPLVWSVWPDQASSLKEPANLSWSNFRHLRVLSPARGRSKLNERKQKGCRPCWSAIILTNNVTTTPTIHPDNKNTIKSDHNSQRKIRRYGSLRNQSSLIRKSQVRKYWERQSCWLRLAARRQALSQWQLMAAGLCVET